MKGGEKGALVQTDKSATLATNNDQYLFQPVYSVENHPADSRVNIDDSGKVQTLTSRMGTGGGNVPMVMEQKPVPAVVYAVDQGGGKSGANVSENKTPTLTCTHGGEPVVAYVKPAEKSPVLTASKASFFMRTEEELASTLVATDYKDPQMVCYRQGGFADYVEGEVGTLKASGGDLGGGSENLVVDSEVHEFIEENNADAPHQQDLLQTADGVARTLACGTHGSGSHLTKTVYKHPEGHYIVRRLTPTECARLQGFADAWGHIKQKDNLTEEEYRFWLEARNTHASINGKETKDYTKAQMLTWYNKLWTDSAEYKMWGNGIALPPALYCMQGIVEAMEKEEAV